ncbi:hypothetical protein [Streptomyces glaucus]
MHDEALGRVAASGLDGLDTSLVTACPVPERQAVVDDNSGGVTAT